MVEDSPIQLKFEIRKLYLKDVSFESPVAPNVFTQDDLTPAIDIHINIDHATLNAEQGYYEVVLGVTVTAKAGEKSLFLAEVQQGGVFEIQGVSEAQLPLALEIGCPNVLLPFAREAIADLVAKGGFPQLLINPVNFEALYQRKQVQTQAAAKKPARSPNQSMKGNGSGGEPVSEKE
ncbi:MAG: protein-export chaperone SecB [Gammaproteobacteria bacterium]|nr:protein-export chaperone SecB [Gammaproteobacteria bacterium]